MEGNYFGEIFTGICFTDPASASEDAKNLCVGLITSQMRQEWKNGKGKKDAS
jgi:hypothetical protein